MLFYPRNSFRYKQRAFTLLEVVVASTIALTIFTVVYHLFFSTLNADKVNENFTSSLMNARKALVRVQRELREARDLVYPSTVSPKKTQSSSFIVYKDKIGLLKIIEFDKVGGLLRLFTVDVRGDEAKLLEGSLEGDLAGEMNLNDSKKILASGVTNISFSYHSHQPGNIQIRVESKPYSLIGGVTLLNL